jgi:hypothetical protein
MFAQSVERYASGLLPRLELQMEWAGARGLLGSPAFM